MKGIKDRVAVVTGSARGIGVGLARAFHECGALVVCVDIQQSGAALAGEFGDRGMFVHADLRRDDDIARIVDATAQKFGAIDFIINAAATYADEGADSTRADWLNGFNSNLIGHIMLVQAALPLLKKSSAAAVVNFTSESGRVGLAGRWIYPATKAAIEQVTRS